MTSLELQSLGPVVVPASDDVPNMRRSLLERRNLVDFVLTGLVWAMAAVAAVPLFPCSTC